MASKTLVFCLTQWNLGFWWKKIVILIVFMQWLISKSHVSSLMFGTHIYNGVYIIISLTNSTTIFQPRAYVYLHTINFSVARRSIFYFMTWAMIIFLQSKWWELFKTLKAKLVDFLNLFCGTELFTKTVLFSLNVVPNLEVEFLVIFYQFNYKPKIKQLVK